MADYGTMTNYQGPQNPQPFGATFFQSLRNSVWRRPEDRWIGGVCAAISYRFGWDVSLVRGVTVILTLFTGGIVFLAYALGWALIPEPNDERIHIEELLRGRFDIAHVGIFAILMGGLSGGIRFGINIIDTPDFFSIGLYRALVPITGVLIVIAFLLIAVSMRKKSKHYPPSQRYPGQPQAPWSTHYENDRPTPGPNGATPTTDSAPYVPTPYAENPNEPRTDGAQPGSTDESGSSTNDTDESDPDAGDPAEGKDSVRADTNDGAVTNPAPMLLGPQTLANPHVTNISSPAEYVPSPRPLDNQTPRPRYSSPMIQPRYSGGVSNYPGQQPQPTQNRHQPVKNLRARQPGPGLPTFLSITGALCVIGAVVWMLSLHSLEQQQLLGILPYPSLVENQVTIFITVALPVIVGSAFILSGLALTIRALQGKPGTWLTVLTIIAVAILPLFVLSLGAQINYYTGHYW